MNREDFELLGDKHKKFEGVEDRSLIPGLPFIIRLDGRAFHTVTKGLCRPYDSVFSSCMIETAKKLVDKLHADIGYTQSDEISLGFKSYDPTKSLAAFGGRIQKLVSISAAIASVEFNKQIERCYSDVAKQDPVLDARVYAYPTEELAAESFLWRETDATRNSLAMAAQAHYSSKELHKVGRSGMHELLHKKGVNWNDYPAFFKRGTYVRRGVESRHLTPEELQRIPEKHRPTGPVERGVLLRLDMPPVHTILNLARVLFHNDPPIFETPLPSAQAAEKETK